MPIYILTNKVVNGGNVIESTNDEGQSWTVVANGEAARALRFSGGPRCGPSAATGCQPAF